MTGEEKVVASMACLRAAGAVVEILGALLMLKCGRVTTGLRINAVLGALGPVVLTLVCGLGLSSIVGRVSWVKLLIILCGAMLVLVGAR
ncbi:MAG: YqhV family protein [Firmicutes bacterium]|jgi:hypothetical protein|nr:YqhV family protein [Bacillota bacterium]MDH7495502.1 DUF2619 domain-containing protein [Bacillota bacterium]